MIYKKKRIIICDGLIFHFLIKNKECIIIIRLEKKKRYYKN